MLKFAVSLSLVLVGVIATAASVPDSGASGDKRRVLTAGLRAMGAVSTPVSASGSYDGLYNVECVFEAGTAVVCKASTGPNEPQYIFNTTEGAVMVGSVLRSNLNGASSALIIKAGLVACNSVGDECIISQASIQ